MEDISFTSKFPQILVTLEFNNKVSTSIATSIAYYHFTKIVF